MSYRPLDKKSQEDLEKLGYKEVDLPEDADISELEDNATDSGVNQDIGGVQSQSLTDDSGTEQKTIVGDNQQVVQGVVSDDTGVNQNESQEQSQISKEEVSRRQEQSESDKLKTQVEEANRKNEYMMQMMAGIVNPQNSLNTVTGTSMQNNPVKQSDLKEPQLSDFINESDYEPDEANDPRTRSGRAYNKFQSSTRVYDRETLKRELKQEVRDESQQLNQQNSALRQAQALAAKYPEFQNPFTKEPDLTKIQNFIQNLSSSDEENLWVDLYEFNKSKPGDSGKSQLQNSENVLQNIGSKANKVSTVTSRHGAEREEKPIPKNVQNLAKVYGNLEIPEDAEFEI